MHATVTDLVTRACDKACHHQRAVAQLHQAGHDFAQVGAVGGLLLVGAAALVIFGIVAVANLFGRR